MSEPASPSDQSLSWTVIPGKTASDALRIIRVRFPEFVEHFPDPDSTDPENLEPYYSYARLAEEILKQSKDKSLLQRISSFVNELILTKDSLFEDLAIVALLESLAQDSALAASLYPNLILEAQEALKQIGRGMYGRSGA